MKNWKIAKTILYITAGILLLVFNESIMSFVGLTVGSVAIVFGLDITVFSMINKKFFGEDALFFGGVTHFLLGVIIFLVSADIKQVCLVWAIWSILREIAEMSKAINEIRERKHRFINLLESLIIIVFCFTMILNPNEEHAHFHVYILGIELLLEVAFPWANELIDSRFGSKKLSERETEKDPNADN